MYLKSPRLKQWQKKKKKGEIFRTLRVFNKKGTLVLPCLSVCSWTSSETEEQEDLNRSLGNLDSRKFHLQKEFF